MQAHRSHASRILTTALVAVLCASLAVPQIGLAAPVTNAKIEAAQREADAAQNKMEDLQANLESAAEDLAQIQSQLDQTTQDLSQASEDLDRETQRLDKMSGRLSRRAVAIYRGGRVQALAMFLGVRDFSDFATRIDIMARIGRSDAQTVSEVKQARAAVQRTQTRLEGRRADELVLRQRAAEKQNEVQQALTAQKSYLAGIRKDISKLIAAEQERQRKLAEERARKAAAEAQARARARGASTSRAAGPLGNAHPEAVDVAMRYLGVPYVWGGASPSGFDCSGLCQYSYNEIGISLPRTSREQFHAGAYIPPDRRDLLQPGDLVFFGRDGDPDRIHHVGMYTGDGEFIEAPYSGASVRISSLDDRISRRGDYVGACRP